jgi:hypothetical protein
MLAHPSGLNYQRGEISMTSITPKLSKPQVSARTDPALVLKPASDGELTIDHKHHFCRRCATWWPVDYACHHKAPRGWCVP